MSLCVIISGGLQFSGVHERISEWIGNREDVKYDTNGGWSWINGKVFYSKIRFTKEEDVSAFMLIFGEYAFIDKYSQLGREVSYEDIQV